MARRLTSNLAGQRPQPFRILVSHSVLLYSIDGWVVSSVSFAGFPPCILILGGPHARLRDLYLLVYDDEAREFNFARLAYTEELPIIPLPVPGEFLESICKTYGLHPC